MTSQANAILTDLYTRANPKNVEEMARFGIKSPKNVLGVSSKYIFTVIKNIGRNHLLALELWKTGIYEARLIAAFIADPDRIEKSTMNSWAHDFDNWAVCDCACMHCFRDTASPHTLVRGWVKEKSEFVRRAGFVMIATLTVHDKKADDKIFLQYLQLVKKYATDERNFVKKAVNWALRQIGKRSLKLNAAAIAMAKKIRELDSPSARWIAADALRELQNPAVRKHLKRRKT